MSITSKLRRTLLAGFTALLPLSASLSAFAPQPAHAIPVFDAANYAQNVLAAARLLTQINNEIQSLGNQAQSLVNEAKNLASLPYSALANLQAAVARTQSLVASAQRIAYDVSQIDAAYANRYGAAAATGSDAALILSAKARLADSIAGFQDALRMQATVTSNLDVLRDEMNALTASSQSAQGALQAAQAGNQMLALQARQLGDLTALLAAQGRAQALESARNAAAAEQGREQRQRFLTPGPARPVTPVTIFH
jgi:type IV secretion system protein TrbJ